MTYKEHLFNLPNEELARLLIKELTIFDCYEITNGETYYLYDDAIERQVELLNSEYKGE